MMEAVAAYLAAQGFERIYRDFMPAPPGPAIGLMVWDWLPETDGTGTRSLQVQVRRGDLDAALADCQHIQDLLDSGLDETPLPIGTPGAVIGRPKRRPLLLDRGNRWVTVYCETALWGKD